MIRHRRGAAAATSSLEDLVVITGFSGAGKSTAMNVFEDDGYFCVDNLPPEMIRGLVDLFVHEGSKVERAAVVSDVRGGELFEALADVLDDLDARGIAHRVLFLDADEETLLGRYKETRRRHPLSPTGSVAQGIAAERAALAPFKARADLVLDTSGISAATLRRRDRRRVPAAPGALEARASRSRPSATSTACRATPTSSFDVRFLPNPHWEPDAAPAHRLRPAGRRVHRRGAASSRRSTSGSTRCSTSSSPSTSPRARRTSASRSAARAGATARSRSPRRSAARYRDARRRRRRGRRTATSDRAMTRPPMIVHVAFEVSDLARSARFYDAIFYALGARRMFESERRDRLRPRPRAVLDRRPRPHAGAGYGHVALAAAGRAAVDGAYAAALEHGGSDDGAARPAAAVRPAVLRRLPARPRRPARRARRRRDLIFGPGARRGARG